MPGEPATGERAPSGLRLLHDKWVSDRLLTVASTTKKKRELFFSKTHSWKCNSVPSAGTCLQPSPGTHGHGPAAQETLASQGKCNFRVQLGSKPLLWLSHKGRHGKVCAQPRGHPPSVHLTHRQRPGGVSLRGKPQGKALWKREIQLLSRLQILISASYETINCSSPPKSRQASGVQLWPHISSFASSFLIT